MMNDFEIREYIKKEVAKQINVLLSGQAGENTSFLEDIANIYPGMPTIPQRPVMHPYGFVSRATQGTFQVTGRVGEHAGNRIVLGHRDKNRPPVNSGETMLYDAYGHEIYLSKSKIQIGSTNSSSPMVLGDILQKFCDDLLTKIEAHTHTSTAPGNPTGPPLNLIDFTTLQLSPIQDGKIISKKTFTE